MLGASPDQRRVAMVENTLVDPDVTAGRRWRFQLDNHLGTATVEVDVAGTVISYEEYHPYGTSAVRVQRSTAGFSQKRYRHTGKERDEETSLYYHGARYYAPWLGRWTAVDPLGMVDGVNLYRYSRCNPVRFSDPSGTQTAAPPLQEHDVLSGIMQHSKPGDAAQWWAEGPKKDPHGWSGTLSYWESGYMSTFQSNAIHPALRMRQSVDPSHLTAEEGASALRLFGRGPNTAQEYANFENRRRILAHYVLTHPATVRLQLGLYRFIRDINPVHFAFERGWQVGSGQEMFTGEQRSRLGAAAEFFTALATGYALGRLLKATKPTMPAPATKPAPPGIDVEAIVSNPRSLWGKSAEEVAAAFNEAGYNATLRQSTRGSQRAVIVKIEGHKEITQIQVHPGGGRHGGAYVKISTSTEGVIKVVDPRSYKPTAGEKAKIVKSE